MSSWFGPVALAATLASFAAGGQGGPGDVAPDESWATFPEDRSFPELFWPPPPPIEAAPLDAVPTRPRAAPRALVAPEPEEFNAVSLVGAQTLGPNQRGFGAFLGFPLLGVRASVGVFAGFDLGVVYESYYGTMNEFRGAARFQFLSGSNWTGAVVLEGGTALFAERASLEDHAGRWLTGRRNYNLMPGGVLSYRGPAARAARLFLDVRYHLAFDTEPGHQGPLGGVPPALVLGHNLPVRFGAELPFSARTSLAFSFGFDLHGRSEDSAFMPVCSVGLVSSF